MTVTVLIWRIDDTYDDGGWGGTTYQAGYYIHVLFDTVTKALTVQIRTGSTDGGGSLIATPTNGPNLFFGHNGSSTRIFPANLEDLYAACDGTTLDYISQFNNFPYAGYAFQEDAPQCEISPVCDLEFTSNITVVPASGPSTADGGFTVLANSSNGTVKYSLTPNFDYAAETNTTGVFSGLLPDDYVVYAKDPLGCQDTINVRLTITIVYGVRLRHEFTDFTAGFAHRIDIEQRAYAGVIEEVDGGPRPIEIEYKGDINDPMKVVVPSNATITLKSKTPGQYQFIFLGDDLQHRVKYYINSELYWTGYVIPEFYSEPYISEPFDISFTATDGLGELHGIELRDSNDNLYRSDFTVMHLISTVLKKSPLGLKIRSFVDVFETTMTATAADDPFAQLIVDSSLFYTSKNVPTNCLEAIEKVLKPFRARLFQSQGYWNIIRKEKNPASSIPYRQFDVDGVYESNGTLINGVSITGNHPSSSAVWLSRTQVLSFVRNYGYVKVTHNLGKDANLIDEGDFEVTDLIEDGNGDVFFKNWNFLIGQTNMSYGHETSLTDGTGAFFAKFQSNTSPQNDSILYTYEIPFAITSGGFVAGDRIKINFKVLTELYYTFPWVRIGWSLRITDNTTGDFISFNAPRGDRSDFDLNHEIVNDLYIQKFDSFESFELGLFYSRVTYPDATLRFALHFHNHFGRDYNNYNEMRTLATVPFTAMDKRLYFAAATGTKVYKLERTIEDESVPDRIRPSDFNLLSNPQQWVLDEDIALGGSTAIVSKFLFDKVQIQFYPFISVDGNMRVVDPPETIVYSEETSRFIKSDLLVDVQLGDCPEFNNAPMIYRGYFRLLDGTPTVKWARQNVTEEEYLNKILLNDLIAQHSNSLRKFQGTLLSDVPIHYINAFTDYLDGVKYLPENFLLDSKYMSTTVELLEIKTGAGGEPPVSLGEFAAEEFSDDFNIGA